MQGNDSEKVPRLPQDKHKPEFTARNYSATSALNAQHDMHDNASETHFDYKDEDELDMIEDIAGCLNLGMNWNGHDLYTGETDFPLVLRIPISS